MIVMIYLLQWSLQDNQHVHERKLKEKNSSWAIALERASE